MMDIENQLVLLRAAYLKTISMLYTQQFRIKLTAVYSCDKKWYELHLHRIDALSAAIEHAIMENNPRRAMRYLFLLYHFVDDLTQKTEMDYTQNLKSLI